MNPAVQKNLLRVLDTLLTLWPHRQPDAADLARAKIVAHRGQRDRRGVRENTFSAFDRVVDVGVAAIEFDVRYTRDDEPVVAHDADLMRVFGRVQRISECRFAQLRRDVPELPHLDELLARYGHRVHLMVELKTRGSERAENRLADLLAPLRPVDDFHMLSLDPELFAGVAGLPAVCRLPVAKRNLAQIFEWVLQQPCAGLAGPYALMRRHHIETLHARRALVGSGFVTRPVILMRELGRGVEWIFTDHAVRLQRALDQARRRLR